MTVAPSPTVAAVPAERLGEAAQVAAHAMRFNPLHAAALGEGPDRRVRVMKAVFDRLLARPQRTVLAAWSDDTIVGVLAHTDRTGCQPSSAEMLMFVPALVSAGRGSLRLLRWQRAWGELDPGEAHSHLGPVAVLDDHQGQGVGSLLLREYTRHLDVTSQVGYLETDKPANVGFYEAHGFQVVAETSIIGVPNWFMVRRPA